MYIRLALPLLLAALVLAFPSPRVYACLCGIVDYSPTEALAAHYAVFMGKVVSEYYDKDGDPTSRTYRFEVETVWKGPAYETIYLKLLPGSCNWGLRVEVTYVVYALDDYTFGQCGLRKPLEDAMDDIAALGEGQIPQPGTISPALYAAESKDISCGQSRGTTDIPVVGLAIGVALFGLLRRRG